MDISINEHSSIRVESAQGLVVYFDPYHVVRGAAQADVVFITHSHYDHFDPESIAAIAKPGTWFVTPLDMASDLRKLGISPRQCIALAPGEAADVEGLAVQAVPAYNVAKAFHPRANQWLGYVVEIDGERLYVCGDTDATPEARAVACDIVCVPVGGTYTMDAEEAAQLVNAMDPRPRTAIPTHYGTVVGRKQDGKRFARLVDSAIHVEMLI